MNHFRSCLVMLTSLAIGACSLGDSDEQNDTEDTDENTSAVTCEPQMSVFPVGDAHNIGYDPTCNDGTCDISCPDQHANSDWGGDHHGMDIFAYRGAPLVAVADGTVVKVGNVSDTSGLRVRLRDACGWEYYYGHLEAAYVKPGQVVKAGDLLGTMGNSGTGGVHLHFNVSANGNYSKDINPIDLLKATSATACGGAPEEKGPDPEIPTNLCGLLGDGGTLERGQYLKSCDERFLLVMQDDGNFVLYQGDVPLWHTSTHGTDASVARLQNGRLTVEGPSGVYWSSNTKHEGAFLSMQDDGNLVVYTPQVTPVWSSETCCH